MQFKLPAVEIHTNSILGHQTGDSVCVCFEYVCGRFVTGVTVFVPQQMTRMTVCLSVARVSHVLIYRERHLKKI